MSKSERGVTLLVVLVLLAVMLLGGLTLARMTEISTLAAGNAAFREASIQASEVGVNTAYAQVRALTAEEADLDSWYYATQQPVDAHGMPQVDFDAAPEITVGVYSVRYVAERLCDTLPVTAPMRQCLMKQVPQIASADASLEKLDPPSAKQFRVTVRVTGPKNTQTWVQSLVTKG